MGPALLEMDQHPLSPLWDLLGQVSRFLYGKCGKPQLAPGRSRSTPGGSTRRRALLPPPSADHPEDSWSSFKAQLKRLCFEALTPQAALGASCANTAFRPHTNVKPGREPASVVLAPKTRSNPRQTPNKHMLPQIPAPVQASLPLSPASASSPIALEPHSSQTRTNATHPTGEHRPLPTEHIWRTPPPSPLPVRFAPRPQTLKAFLTGTGHPICPPQAHNRGHIPATHSATWRATGARQGRAEQTGEGTCSGAGQRPRSTRDRSLGRLG